MFFYKSLPMIGFELPTSGVGSDQSTNCVITTALPKSGLLDYLLRIFKLFKSLAQKQISFVFGRSGIYRIENLLLDFYIFCI